MLWFYFILLCICELGADVFAKHHVVTKNSLFAVLAVAGYVAGNTAWVFSLRSGMLLSVGAVLFGIITGISAMVVGMLLYHEQVSRYQMLGLALGLVSIALLTFGADHAKPG